MKSIATFLFSFFLVVLSYGQECPQFQVTLDSQEKINDFRSQYPNCTILEGSLTILNSSDIIDLSPLSNIIEVRGTVTLHKLANLTSLAGLENLSKIGGGLSLDTDGLTDISALNNLLTIGESLTISSATQKLEGFTALESIGFNLTIKDSDELEEISGFNSLSYIPLDLLLSGLPALRKMDKAFNNLDSIGDKLIFNQTGLVQFAGLDQLQRIEGLTVINNSEIKDLTGLTALREIHHSIIVRGNDQLVSLAGLDNIDVQYLKSSTALTAESNPLLEICDLDYICRILRLPNSTIRISGNAPACSNFKHLFYNVCRAHVCYSDDLKFTTQEDINNFSTLYPKCTYIEGDLVIGSRDGTVSSTVVNINGLSQIDTISGDAIFSNNNMATRLSGVHWALLLGGIQVTNNDRLEKLTVFDGQNGFLGDIIIADNQSLKEIVRPRDFESIDGDLIIRNNPVLTTIEELEELKVITGDFIIENNATFYSAGTLDRLQWVGGDLISRNNPRANSPYIMRNIRIVGGDWVIEDNPLTTGLPSVWLDSLGGSLIVRNNPTFSELSSSLQFIGGDLIVENVPQLNEISVASVELIGGDFLVRSAGMLTDFKSSFSRSMALHGKLTIEDNPLLENLDGLQWLQASEVDKVEINNNPSLSKCNIGLVCAKLLDDPAAIEVSGNTGICQDSTTLRVPCDTGICYSNGGHLFNQREIDAFVAACQACRIVEGSLDVRSSAGHRLDVSEFHFIEVINGSLDLSSHSFGNTLQLGNGLRNLSYVGEDFFYDVDNEIDFSGISNLEEVGGRFMMWSDVIETFRGLEKLKSVGSLELFTSDKLKSLEGLEGLKYIDNKLQISYSDSLSSLKGLENVEYVGTRIQLRGGPLLTDIYAINHIDPRDMEALTIASPNLTDCNLKLICEFMFLNPEWEFLFGNNNVSDCSEFSEVACEDYGVSGYAFYDANANGIKEAGEFGIPNVSVQMNLANREMLTNEKGKYISYMVEGQQFSLSVEAGPEWRMSTPTNYEGIFAVQDSNIFDIGLVPIFDRHSSTVFMSPENIRCNESGRYYLTFQNTGTYTESGEIHLQYDPSMTFVDSKKTPNAHNEATSTLIWHYRNLRPYESIEIELEFIMPNQLFVNEDLVNQLSQYYYDEKTISILGEFTSYDRVRCAVDPNDKRISPPGQGAENFVLRDESVVYTLRFQNIGNDYARNIRLIDTLSGSFDRESFELLHASHNVYSHFEDNVIHFYFDDIYLIDSLTNPLESQGQLSYRINFKGDLPDSTVVNNSADIYFDYNDPIRTNTTSNTVIEKWTTGTTEPAQKQAFVVYPNPTSGLVQFELSTAGVLKIYDSSFSLVSELIVDQNNLRPKMHLKDQASGIYFIQFIDASGGQHGTKVYKE